jgi:hypothetical protein
MPVVYYSATFTISLHLFSSTFRQRYMPNNQRGVHARNAASLLVQVPHHSGEVTFPHPLSPVIPKRSKEARDLDNTRPYFLL